MKNLIILACTLSVIAAIPLPSQEHSKELDILQIPLQDNKELDVISLSEDEDDGASFERNKRTIGILRELFPELSKIALNPENADNSIDVAALNSQLETINRVVRNTASQTGDSANDDNNKLFNQNNNGDQDVQASEDQKSIDSKAPAIDELSLDEEDADENRNKRFLNFGFGGGAGAGGGGGGSGNFLFDVVRRTADRAARAAGTIYRVVAGTESLGINGNKQEQIIHRQQQQQKQQHSNINNYETSRTLTKGLSIGLFSGGSGTEQTDEQENAPVDDTATVEHTAKSTAYTEGIPGPVTRLFVLANRGIANLIQDLILRIAATSERVVNFKARLVTALI